MTPHPVGRDAQVSGPSMHAAETSMACGQRRMVGRSSSIIETLCSAAQAVQTMTVKRAVGSPAWGSQRGLLWSASPRSEPDRVILNPFLPSCWCLKARVYQRSALCPG